MVATRQDAWTEDNDLLLAEVILRHIREGSTQLAAFEEVGERLNRTPAACGFRWNSLIRKKYESAIKVAKAQRQQLKAKGKKRYMNVSKHSDENAKIGESSSLLPQPIEAEPTRVQEEDDSELSFDKVIRFLRQQKEASRELQLLQKTLAEKNEQINGLMEENERMRKQLDDVQNEYVTVNDDYKALIKIMDRARKLAILTEEEAEDNLQFKMDKNGNLERVEKN